MTDVTTSSVSLGFGGTQRMPTRGPESTRSLSYLIDVSRQLFTRVSNTVGKRLRYAAKGGVDKDADTGNRIRAELDRFELWVMNADVESLDKDYAHTRYSRSASSLYSSSVHEMLQQLLLVLNRSLVEGTNPTRAHDKLLMKWSSAPFLWRDAGISGR